MKGPARAAALLLVASGLAPVSCAADLSAKSDREARSELDALRPRMAPAPLTPRPTAAPAVTDAAAAGGAAVPAVLDLAGCLRVAAERNRDLLRQREGLTLSALAVLDARNAIGPRLTGTLRHALADSDRGEATSDSGGTVTASAVLPTGATASVSADTGKTRGSGSALDSSASGTLTARVSQPLLRGAGYDASHEALTDAERQAVYDLRSFELARQDLALDVQQAYYGIVAQKQVVRNRETRLDSLEFLKRRSERLFEMGRVSEVDKFRAVREHLTAENDLVDARQELAVRIDRFKILLHMDTATPLDISESIPAARRVDADLQGTVAAALANRLDLATARDQVEDAGRRERIREREMLPDVRLDLTASRADDDARGFSGVTPLARDSYGAGVSVEIPFDRVRERNAFRAAKIATDRARRDLTSLEDQVVLDVRDALRRLRSAESSLAIQEQITASEEKNVKIARLRFEEGTIGNRDLTDALANLADAQDRLVRERTNVEVARLRLARAAGTLTLEEDGTWRE